MDFSIRVLVVDDMLLMRKVMVKALEDIGFKAVEQSENGALAWQLIDGAEKAKKPYGLILCDFKMPQLSGLDLLKKIRADERFKKLPFVMCTLESERQHVIDSVRHGVSQFVIKPLTNEVLLEKLQGVFQKL